MYSPLPFSPVDPKAPPTVTSKGKEGINLRIA
jgi:hypothetical protein